MADGGEVDAMKAPTPQPGKSSPEQKSLDNLQEVHDLLTKQHDLLYNPPKEQNWKPSQRMADGGKVGGAKTGGAKTSTTGNKTKTGGSNPGGASTGGAGTVTVTVSGKTGLAKDAINISGVGGKTDARNPGGMDPSDEDDKDTMMANGGRVDPTPTPDDYVTSNHMDVDEINKFSKAFSPASDQPAAAPSPKQESNGMVDRIMKKMGHASGGDVDQDSLDYANEISDLEVKKAPQPPTDLRASEQDAMDNKMVDRIMKMRKMSKGGEVANEGEDELSEMADSSPNEFDDLALDDDLHMSETGSNSGDELSDDQEDEDRKDIVSRIMKSRAKKDKLPRPA